MQGALLSPQTCSDKDLDGLALAADDILVVISHSCDIARGDEPNVEVHVGRSVAEVDGNYTYRKNPRTLDLTSGIGGTRRPFRFSQTDRRPIPRARLLETRPIGTLSAADVELLARWTADRYTRPALPDAFNERRKPTRERIARAARRGGIDISGIYVALKPEAELPDGEAYEIAVLGIVPSETARASERWAKACAAVNAIVEALSCPGIKVVDSETRGEAAVSLEDIKQYIRLDLDYISEREALQPEPG